MSQLLMFRSSQMACEDNVKAVPRISRGIPTLSVMNGGIYTPVEWNLLPSRSKSSILFPANVFHTWDLYLGQGIVLLVHEGPISTPDPIVCDSLISLQEPGCVPWVPR